MCSYKLESIFIKNNIDDIAEAMTWLGDLAIKNNWDERFRYHLELSLEEILTNIIKYAYSDIMEHSVLLEAKIFSNGVEIMIVDDGVEMNPLLISPPDIYLSAEDRPIGGLGIHIIRNIVDEVEYERKGLYNKLWLRKNSITQAR